MESLAGTIWKVIEAHNIDEAGRESLSSLGPTPMGVLMFEAERMMGMICDGQSSLPPDAPPRVFLLTPAGINSTELSWLQVLMADRSRIS